MKNELVLCIPGPWKNRNEFVSLIASETKGDFMFAGGILVNPPKDDHIGLEFYEYDKTMRDAFEYAGQDKLSKKLLEKIDRHSATVYLFFPFPITENMDKIKRFVKVIKKINGFAIKIESTGIAHDWKNWDSIIKSNDLFEIYSGFVVLISDDQYYYSCGMHNFGFPDIQITRDIDINEAADLMNRFNFWVVSDNPTLDSGHTFSLTEDSPYYKIELVKDNRHDKEELFYNQNGLWNLAPVN